MAIDDNARSPYRDRIYVTWTAFAADGTAYIYEVHSSDYGETFSSPVLVSASMPTCTNSFGVTTTPSTCNENQFSDPFIGPDRKPVRGLEQLQQSAHDRERQQLPGAAGQVDRRRSDVLGAGPGQSVLQPAQLSAGHLPGSGGRSGRSCVPEKGSSTVSVFRATNYPSGAVDPHNPNVVAVTFGSYINKDSNESNGCVPAGFADDGNPIYTRRQDTGRVRQQDPVERFDRRRRDVHGHGNGPTDGDAGHAVAGPAPYRSVLAVGRLHARRQVGGGLLRPSVRRRRDDRIVGLQPVGERRPDPLRSDPPHDELDAGADAVRGPRRWPVLRRLRLADGQRQGLSDLVGRRAQDLFLCPNTGVTGVPPKLCGATETNGEVANDEETYMAAVNVPTAQKGPPALVERCVWGLGLFPGPTTPFSASLVEGGTTCGHHRVDRHFVDPEQFSPCSSLRRRLGSRRLAWPARNCGRSASRQARARRPRPRDRARHRLQAENPGSRHVRRHAGARAPTRDKRPGGVHGHVPDGRRSLHGVVGLGEPARTRDRRAAGARKARVRAPGLDAVAASSHVSGGGGIRTRGPLHGSLVFKTGDSTTLPPLQGSRAM